METLLRKFRDHESVDREEWEKREALRYDVEFECEARGISLMINDQVERTMKLQKEV